MFVLHLARAILFAPFASRVVWRAACKGDVRIMLRCGPRVQVGFRVRAAHFFSFGALGILVDLPKRGPRMVARVEREARY
jgi:hypothetical protein